MTRIPVLCKHSENGCEIETSRDAIEIHEMKCEFRPVSCVDCEDAIPFHQMVDHIYKDHEEGDFVDAMGSTQEVSIVAFQNGLFQLKTLAFVS